MNLHGQKFNGRMVSGKSCSFMVEIKLDADEKLTVQVEDVTYHHEYFAQIKHEDIQRESSKNGIQTIIQTPSELYMTLQENLKAGHTPFERLVQIGPNHEIKLHLEMKLNFTTGVKKKNLTYQFPTVKKIHTDNMSNVALGVRMKNLEEQHHKLRMQMKQIRSILRMIPSSEQSLLREVQYIPNTIITYGNSMLSISRGLSFLYQKKPIDPMVETSLKFRVATNCLIYICIFRYSDLLKDHDTPSFKYIDLQRCIHCLGGQIVTVRLNEYKYDAIVEKNQIEEISLEKKDEEEETLPNFSYSKVKQSVQFKRLISFTNLHLGIGLEFGGKIEVLEVDLNN